jgi:hypothetical protein
MIVTIAIGTEHGSAFLNQTEQAYPALIFRHRIANFRSDIMKLLLKGYGR